MRRTVLRGVWVATVCARSCACWALRFSRLWQRDHICSGNATLVGEGLKKLPIMAGAMYRRVHTAFFSPTFANTAFTQMIWAIPPFCRRPHFSLFLAVPTPIHSSCACCTGSPTFRFLGVSRLRQTRLPSFIGSRDPRFSAMWRSAF